MPDSAASSIEKLLAEDFGGEPGKRDVLLALVEHIDAVNASSEERHMRAMRAINVVDAHLRRVETAINDVEQKLAAMAQPKRSPIQRLLRNN